MKKYIKENRLYIVVLIVVVIVGAGIAIGVQFLKGEVLNLALAGDFSKLITVGWILLLAILLEIAFMYGEYLVENRIDFLCTAKLKEDVFQATLSQDYATFTKKPIGEYVTKFTTEVDQLRQAYLNSLFMLIMFGIKIIFVTGALIWLDWQLAGMTLLLLTMPLYIPKLAQKVLVTRKNKYLEEMEHFLGRVTNYLDGFEVIKNYKIEHNVLNQFIKTNRKTMQAGFKSDNTSAFVRVLSTFMSYFSYFVIVIFSAYLVVQGEFNAGEFFIAINMIDQLSYPLIALSGCIESMIGVRALNERVAKYCQQTVEDKDVGVLLDEKFQHCIALTDVSFEYEAEKSVLEGINMVFEKGKKYLIRGQSGVGKTTLINLLLSYYKPTKGNLYIDHLKELNKNTVYDLTTVVRQDPFIFNDTLRNNLTLYKEIPDDQLLHVLKQVQLQSLATLESLERQIGAGGSRLSGGEQKRLCIARALLHQKEIMILDEPLANLDHETMLKLEEEILALKDITLILISHVISKEAEASFDKVLTLAHGQLA